MGVGLPLGTGRECSTTACSLIALKAPARVASIAIAGLVPAIHGLGMPLVVQCALARDLRPVQFLRSITLRKSIGSSSIRGKRVFISDTGA